MDTISVGRRLTLHLGVIVQPYRTRGKKARGITTAEVAQILEDKYGLFSVYFRVSQKLVSSALENSVAGALESLMMGAKRIDPWGAATQKIETGFRDFISSRAAERSGIPGTPTAAALAGVNHRLKHPYRKANPRRPSFRDTALLMTNFKAWVD